MNSEQLCRSSLAAELATHPFFLVLFFVMFREDDKAKWDLGKWGEGVESLHA